MKKIISLCILLAASAIGGSLFARLTTRTRVISSVSVEPDLGVVVDAENRVVSVTSHSSAERAGLKIGDVIVTISGVKISAEGLTRQLASGHDVIRKTIEPAKPGVGIPTATPSGEKIEVQPAIPTEPGSGLPNAVDLPRIDVTAAIAEETLVPSYAVARSGPREFKWSVGDKMTLKLRREVLDVLGQVGLWGEAMLTVLRDGKEMRIPVDLNGIQYTAEERLIPIPTRTPHREELFSY